MPENAAGTREEFHGHFVNKKSYISTNFQKITTKYDYRPE